MRLRDSLDIRRNLVNFYPPTVYATGNCIQRQQLPWLFPYSLLVSVIIPIIPIKVWTILMNTDNVASSYDKAVETRYVVSSNIDWLDRASTTKLEALSKRPEHRTPVPLTLTQRLNRFTANRLVGQFLELKRNPVSLHFTFPFVYARKESKLNGISSSLTSLFKLAVSKSGETRMRDVVRRHWPTWRTPNRFVKTRGSFSLIFSCLGYALFFDASIAT